MLSSRAAHGARPRPRGARSDTLLRSDRRPRTRSALLPAIRNAMSAATSPRLTAPELFGYRKYWAHRLHAGAVPADVARGDGRARLGQCDIILVTGDAYVDHPSFGMAVIGRVLEAQGFRVGIIAQPDWHIAEPFKALGQAEPVLRRHRRQHGLDDQPLHGGPEDPQRRRVHARRRRRQAARPRVHRLLAALPRGFKDVPIVLGGIEAQPAPHRALRLLAGQGAPLDRGGRQVRPAAVRQRRARDRRDRASPGGARAGRRDHRRARHGVRRAARRREGWFEIDSTSVDEPGRVEDHVIPTRRDGSQEQAQGATCARRRRGAGEPGRRSVVRFDAAASPTCRPRAQRASACRPTSRSRRPGAVCARQPRAAPGNQPGQRARAGAGARRRATCGSTRRRSR